ncbi:MAG TPA: radical SAM protein [Acidobacteriaceae bacterium]|nr:radical SAM protein [Acidobacteriaceae bacterium]
MSIQMSENNPTVRIDHEDAERKNILFVDWMLGNACNYACSYCPPALHDGTERWVPATTILTFAEAVTRHAARQHRKVVFQLAGGEVTAIPYFLETLRSLKALGIATLIISNGTKHLDWWEKAVPFLDEVVLTFHPERAVLDHFLRVVQMVSAGIRTHVNVAAPPERFDACVHVAETLANACTDITITLKPMLIGFSDKLYPYTPQQLEILQSRPFTAPSSTHRPSFRGPMLATDADGSLTRFEASQFVATGRNQWFSWQCNAGLELLCIKSSGDIFRGECKVGGKIGNVADVPNISWPAAAITCTRKTCSCLLDIMTTRWHDPASAVPTGLHLVNLR